MSPVLKDSWNYGRGRKVMMGLIFPLAGEELTCEDGAREEERSGEMKSNSESGRGKGQETQGCSDCNGQRETK